MNCLAKLLLQAFNKATKFLPTILAICSSSVLFLIFLMINHKPALEAGMLVVEGAFGSLFALANTLQRAAPLMLTALCVAIPARAGLVIIGGEGALVLGGLVAAVLPLWLPPLPPFLMIILMALGAMFVGGCWIGLSGWMRQKRGVNETIGSLLLAYIGIAIFKQLVEGVLRDPASLNKPSTSPIPDAYLIGQISDSFDVHWGFVVAIIVCICVYFLMTFTIRGFSMKVVGGNTQTAKMLGLPVNKLIIFSCFLGGAATGLAGMFEVAAVQGSANAALIAGYGTSGILVAFAARQNPLAIIVCAILLGGVEASGSMLQRRLGLPDATTLILEGLLFTNILLWEAVVPRINTWLQKKQNRLLLNTDKA